MTTATFLGGLFLLIGITVVFVTVITVFLIWLDSLGNDDLELKKWRKENGYYQD